MAALNRIDQRDIVLLIQDLVERCQSILIGASRAILKEENYEADSAPLEAVLEESRAAALSATGVSGVVTSTTESGAQAAAASSTGPNISSGTPRFVSRERIIDLVS